MINEKINKSLLNIISPPSFFWNLAITQLLNVPTYNYTKHISIVYVCFFILFKIMRRMPSIPIYFSKFSIFTTFSFIYNFIKI